MSKNIKDTLGYKIGYKSTELLLKGTGGLLKWAYNGLKGRDELKEHIEQWAEMFRQINLVALDGSIPIYQEGQLISDFVFTHAFISLIPLSNWSAKKEVIEKYLNVNIVGIDQDKDDNRITYLHTEIMPLPSMIVWKDSYIPEKETMLGIGKFHFGVIGLDLKQYPHTFIAGETGSGKTNLIRCLIYQALYKYFDVVLIDFKRGVSFSGFSDYVNVYYDYEGVTRVLKNLVDETINRLDKFRKAHVDNIDDYNNNIYSDYINRIVVFIDELAQLLRTRDKNISNTLTDCLETITRLSRAAGIHLIMGIQRPDSTIVNGQIKNNVSFRICGRFADKEPSRIVLGNDEANRLPNIKGRFIVKGDYADEVQSFYFTDDDIDPELIYDRRILKEDIKPIKQMSTSTGLDFNFSDIQE